MPHDIFKDWVWQQQGMDGNRLFSQKHGYTRHEQSLERRHLTQKPPRLRRHCVHSFPKLTVCYATHSSNLSTIISMSHIISHLSCVTCYVSSVTWHMSCVKKRREKKPLELFIWGLPCLISKALPLYFIFETFLKASLVPLHLNFKIV